MHWAHNKFSLIAIIIGALSVIFILTHQNFERKYVQAKPKLEQIVHEKISGLKKATLDAIKGKPYQEVAINEVDDQLHALADKMEFTRQASFILSILGIVIAAISFIRHENKHSAQIALALNGGVLVTSLVIYAAMGIASIIAVLLVIWFIGSLFNVFSIF